MIEVDLSGNEMLCHDPYGHTHHMRIPSGLFGKKGNLGSLEGDYPDQFKIDPYVHRYLDGGRVVQILGYKFTSKI
jgi:hypothetical protein